MKNICFAMVLICSTGCCQLEAQDYKPMLGDTNVWTYSAWPWNFVSIITAEDSVNNNMIYQNILHKGWLGSGWSSMGMLREDTVARQVWYIEPDSTRERIIYDFSLNEGDSIWLQFNAIIYGQMLQDGWYFVDSIRNRTITDINRRVFYLDNSLNRDLEGFGSKRPYIEWIEGVGSNLHPCYFVVQDCAADICGIHFIYGASVICAFKNDVHIYQDSCFFPPYEYWWSCYGPTSINETFQDKLFEIYPNPAVDECIIKVDNAIYNMYEVEIKDINGKTLNQFKAKEQELNIDLTEFGSGIYFITLYINDKTQTKKIIKQ